MEALWKRGSTTVRELVEDGKLELAYTTLMTTLDRLYMKNLLSREAEGRAYRYRPRVTRDEFDRATAGEALRLVLDAAPNDALPLSYLVEILSDHDAQLLDDLGRLVESKRQELRSAADRKTETKQDRQEE